MIIKAINENRLLKTIISILLCLTVTAFTILIKVAEVYAVFPLAIPLIGAGLLIAAGLLIMAGLSFESADQATLASNQWYTELRFGKYGLPRVSETEREQALTDFMNMQELSEEVTSISDDIWRYTKEWVDNYYDEGENNINRDLYTVEDEYGNYIPYCLNEDDRLLMGNTIEWMGDVFEWRYDGKYPRDGFPGQYEHKWTLMKDGVSTGQYVKTQLEIEPQFYIFANYEDKLRVGIEYKYSDTSTKTTAITGDTYKLSGYQGQIQMARDYASEVEYNIAATGAVGVVDNPEWDFETEDESRSVYVPTDGTIETYVGLTHDELLTMINEAITDQPIEDTEDRTWWQDLIGGVSAKVEEAGQLLVGTLADLKAWLDGTYQNIISSVNTAAASIEDAIEAQQEEDIEPKLKEFRLPSLLILFLDVLLACIRLVIRACVYLVTIVEIQPDGSLLNDDAQSGLNFFKNQVIPVINISVWDMYSGLMSLVISLAVVKRVRRTAE